MDGGQPSGLELGLLTVTLGQTQEEEEKGLNRLLGGNQTLIVSLIKPKKKLKRGKRKMAGRH